MRDWLTDCICDGIFSSSLIFPISIKAISSGSVTEFFIFGKLLFVRVVKLKTL